MFDKKKVKLGIAPIAWTNDDMPDLGSENTFEQCVSDCSVPFLSLWKISRYFSWMILSADCIFLL